jgi:rubrerythrin
MKKNIILVAALLIASCLYTACTKSKPDNETIDNLKSSLISENFTSARYTAFSEKAERDGYLQIAKLFKALSMAESVHARNFKKVLDDAGVKIEKSNPEFIVESTEKNLQNAIEEEIMDVDSVDPVFIKQSANSEIKQANDVFTFVWEAEKTHKDLLVMIYDILMTKEIHENGIAVASAPASENLSTIEDLFSKTDYYVCPIDGRVFDSTNLSEKCGLCSTTREKFIKIN